LTLLFRFLQGKAKVTMKTKAFTRLAGILTAAAILAVGCTMGENGDDVIGKWDCGDQGDNVTATLRSNGRLTISVTYSSGWMMYEYTATPPWYEMRNQITSVVIGGNVASIGSNAFRDHTNLTEMFIPGSVISIGRSAFAGSGLTSVTLGSRVKTIGNGAFANTGLTSIIIPNSVASIGDSAFTGCAALTFVTIGSGITSIGNCVFDDCASLTSITVLSLEPPTINEDAFERVDKTTVCLYVPEKSLDTYKSADGWKDFTCVNPADG
jgi:hypothetical protein